MENKTYVYVGNWSFQARPEKGKGISVFSYNERNGELKLLETIRPDVAAGQLYLDSENKILYAVNECGERRGEIGGGGYLMAFGIDEETGSLTLINERHSLSPEPSYITLDQKKKYLLTCHCADPFHVTKVVKNEKGEFCNQVLFDDTGLCMFRINEDGSIGNACDVVITKGSGGNDSRSKVNIDTVSGHIQLVDVISRLHSVVRNPSGSVFAVCDKGMDCIYTYRIDYEKEKLEQLDKWTADQTACFPRYGTFHPFLPIYYANNENHASLNYFKCDEESGKLTLLGTVPLLSYDPGMVEGKPVGAQDILMSLDGKHLYCTLCGLNLIIVMKLEEDGKPVVVQEVNCRGILPRGIQISPDGKYLLSGNMISGDITTFKIQEDGTLKATGKCYQAISPSAIRFFVAES